jgi:hypothetical protein
MKPTTAAAAAVAMRIQAASARNMAALGDRVEAPAGVPPLLLMMVMAPLTQAAAVFPAAWVSASTPLAHPAAELGIEKAPAVERQALIATVAPLTPAAWSRAVAAPVLEAAAAGRGNLVVLVLQKAGVPLVLQKKEEPLPVGRGMAMERATIIVRERVAGPPTTTPTAVPLGMMVGGMMAGGQGVIRGASSGACACRLMGQVWTM